MRRRPGTLLPLEMSILEAALELRSADEPEFHGFAIAREIKARDEARALTAHGTLYKALGRMEQAGLLESEWENPDAAAGEGRPRRRLYRVTGLGERTLREQQLSEARAKSSLRPLPQGGV
jgi:PadR family transcriptional regulator PadR